ncbi:hypothetical protein BsWGS_12779 [Bradybaena similaris]
MADDSEDSDSRRMTFDYSSAFTFEEKDNFGSKYKSAFTYGVNDASKVKSSVVAAPTNIDKLAKLFVLVGYIIVYIFTFPVMVWFSFKKIPQNERLVVFRLGHLHRMKGPGCVFLFPVLDRCHTIDVRLKAFSVPPKQVITEDGAIIEVGAEIYFQIVDAEKSVTSVQNLDQSTRILVQTSLCNILAKKPLADIEAERRLIADTVLVGSNKTSMDWGVEISRVELSQIKVLSNPPEKKPPMFVKPPGLFGSDAGGMPEAFAQLATALASPQGPGQTQAITQAMQSMVAGCMPIMNNPSDLTSHTNDLAAFLGSSDHDSTKHNLQDGGTGTASTVPLLLPLIPLASSAQMPPVLRPEDVLSQIRMCLCESVVEKVQETYQFEISGAGAGTYYLDLKHGQGFLGQGPDPAGDPAATLSLTFDDLQAMLLGELKPFQAYMSGRLKVSGDTAAALKLEELGNRLKSMTL